MRYSREYLRAAPRRPARSAVAAAVTAPGSAQPEILLSRTSRVGPRVDDRGSGAAATGATAGTAAQAARAAAAGVLRAAATLAAQCWDRRNCDVYCCLRSAWADHGYAVAYTTLTAPLRHLVVDGNLLSFNDTHERGEIVALFNRGAELTERGDGRRAPQGAA